MFEFSLSSSVGDADAQRALNLTHGVAPLSNALTAGANLRQTDGDVLIRIEGK
jgi:hypothetical protein